MTKSEQGRGTVRPILNRTTGAVIGYQALLPRELSRPKPNCKNPKLYQQPIGERQGTAAAARALLEAAITERIEPGNLTHGLPFSHYLEAEIARRFRKARKELGAEHADAHLASWRSAERVHFAAAPFYGYAPRLIDAPMLQAWIEWLEHDYVSKKTGEPLARSSVANLGEMARSVFKLALPKATHNPMDAVELPAKDKDPKIKYLTELEQRRFFGSEEIELRDRVMAGCLLAFGARIGELISLEVEDLFLDDHNPHLIVRYGGRRRAQTKGRSERRVELFEPGLGFFKLWMRDYYRGGVRIFEGPKGGFLSNWAMNFAAEREDGKPTWREIVGGKPITSHCMRHTYAVAVLSGTWGYEPQGLDFVQLQLRHSSRAVTEKYYARFAPGAAERQVRHMTGRQVRNLRTELVTAAKLLRLPDGCDVSFDASGAKKGAISTIAYLDGLVENEAQTPEETGSTDVPAHQTIRAFAREVLRLIGEGDYATLSELARAALVAGPPRAQGDSTAQEVG